MKKILKSILIATASLGTIAGSVSSVVSCGEATPVDTKANQESYDKALASLKSKIGNGDILGNFNIVHDGSSSDVEMQKLNQKIADKVTDMINKDNAIKDILGAVTVVTTKASFNTSTVAPDIKHATGTTLSIASDLAGVTLPTAWSVQNINYIVVGNSQDNYNEEVDTIMTTIGQNNNEATNSFLVNETDVQIKAHILELINDAISIDNKYVQRFPNADSIPGLSAIATAIHNNATASKTGQTTVISGITFLSKEGVAMTSTREITLAYKVLPTKQEQYKSQLKSIIDQFTVDSRSYIWLVDGMTAAEATTKVIDTLANVIRQSPTIYSLLDPSAITIQGITDSTFQFRPGPHEETDNAVTNGVTITIGTTDAAVTPPTTASAFQFFYAVRPSAADVANYTGALSKILAHFLEVDPTTNIAKNPIAFIVDKTAGNGWQTSVTTTIQKAISAYFVTDPSLATNMNIENLGVNIDVQYNPGRGNFVQNPTAGIVTDRSEESDVTILVQAIWDGIQQEIQEFKFFYTVSAS